MTQDIAINYSFVQNNTHEQLVKKLSLAIEQGELDNIKDLIDQGADINAQCYKWSALNTAIVFLPKNEIDDNWDKRDDYIQIIKLLMENGVDIYKGIYGDESQENSDFYFKIVNKDGEKISSSVSRSQLANKLVQTISHQDELKHMDLNQVQLLELNSIFCDLGYDSVY